MTALTGLKVLDFSGLLPAPFGTRILADLGADVLRVEAPTRPDMVRVMPPFDNNGLSAAHGALNRNKQSIAIDLKTPEGIEIIKALVKDYDIVVEQFRPNVMTRLGIGYEQLKAINPKLIYCAVTGYGQDGVYKNRAGHDLNYLAIAGVLDYTGRANAGPVPLPIQAADVTGGMYAVIGILSAVIHRQHTGQGQFVDISLTDAAFSLQALTAPPALMANIQPKPETDTLNGGTFYDCYQTADGRYLSIAGLEPQFFMAFAQSIHRPDLIPLSIRQDEEAVTIVKTAIREAIITKTFAEWQAIFAPIEACVEPVLSFAEACEHPQLQARQMVVNVPNGYGQQQKQIATPIVLSESPARYEMAGCQLGAHTQEILSKYGFTQQQIKDWQQKGIIVAE
ncbi:crotonobetainyl-CoA:carnitine CoA-transferase CaiB-like acyl-CoA transferase [Agitococcus lubricus]|uniref:Crotonobetainyl-CoA:carnitine CoA-transferase CaiB-like acyl-CoA transferase n=2 Tax=Agitococcus lubricus TaxID=1077255 RepID=A0A2T5IWM6_9GAMM|nr:CaiB/BaiF CoA-transferase family protein [Agitococcus lubricus]PTQ88294.1 crotonobetainyl-CoA:carnitine CoA-transferase CaiB-like acyl-CoA transferase [Agitococcus lubricus]